MRKPFKVMTTTSMVAALAATSLVPVAVSADVKEDTVAKNIENTVFSYDGKENLEISFTDYRQASSAGLLDSKGLTYIKGDNGKYYLFSDYRQAYNFTENVEETFKILEPVELKNVKAGEIDTDSKKVVAKDEQPEDRLNETFFYNVA